MKIQKQWLQYLTILVLLTVIFLLFSSTTSPFYPNNYGVDSAFNRFVGLMVRQGKVLYSEIWDHKGPILFFIQAIGTLKGTHNADITLTFIMQILSIFFMFVFLIQADDQKKTDNRKLIWTVTAVLFSMAVFCRTMEGGNLNEEWSLPMIGCSLALLAKYARNVSVSLQHPRKYAFIHGVCLGLLAFIRINNAISICAGLAVVAIYLAAHKQWRNIAENILFGILGIALAALPICAYFLLKNSLYDMFYAVFIHNLKYAEQRTHKTFYGVDLLLRYLPLAGAFLIVLVHLIRVRKFELLDAVMVTAIASNAAMLANTNIFLHYFTLFVPIYMLVLILYVDFSKIPELAISVLVICFFLVQDIPLLSDFPDARNQPDTFAFAASIPEEEKGSAMVLYATPAVYLNSGLIPCSRFAAYHFSYFPVEPSMKEEFLDVMLNNPPNWIVYLGGYEGIIPEIAELLDEKYELMAMEYGLDYYRRIDL